MSEAEKKRLNQLGRSLFRENKIFLREHEDYDWIKNEGCSGYAEFYLVKCWNVGKALDYSKVGWNKLLGGDIDRSILRTISLLKFLDKDEINIQVYTKLVQLDSKLGTTSSEQLGCCLKYTTRSNIIKVQISCLNSRF